MTPDCDGAAPVGYGKYCLKCRNKQSEVSRKRTTMTPHVTKQLAVRNKRRKGRAQRRSRCQRRQSNVHRQIARVSQPRTGRSVGLASTRPNAKIKRPKSAPTENVLQKGAIRMRLPADHTVNIAGDATRKDNGRKSENKLGQRCLNAPCTYLTTC